MGCFGVEASSDACGYLVQRWIGRRDSPLTAASEQRREQDGGEAVPLVHAHTTQDDALRFAALQVEVVSVFTCGGRAGQGTGTAAVSAITTQAGTRAARLLRLEDARPGACRSGRRGDHVVEVGATAPAGRTR